jgi:hypothetical protein
MRWTLWALEETWHSVPPLNDQPEEDYRVPSWESVNLASDRALLARSSSLRQLLDRIATVLTRIREGKCVAADIPFPFEFTVALRAEQRAWQSRCLF